MSNKSEIVGLQYLRAFAAISVVIYHAGGMAAFPKYFGRAFYPDKLHYGAAGVNVFFIISGFIISIVSLDSSLQARVSPYIFFAKRFARIIPLMWLSILSYAALRMVGRGPVDWMPVVRAMILSPAGSLAPLIIWTLRHEFIFYIMFAVCFLGRPSLRPIMFAWFLAPIVYAVAGLPDYPQSFASQALRSFASTVNIQFGIGFVLGIFWLKNDTHQNLKFFNADTFVIIFVAYVCLIGIYAVRGGEPHFTWVEAAGTGLLALPVVLLAIYAICPAGKLQQFGRLLGAASYSIYLFHAHVVSTLLGIWAKYYHETPIILVIAGVTIASTIVGVVVHVLIERPFVAFAQSALLGVRKPVLAQSQ